MGVEDARHILRLLRPRTSELWTRVVLKGHDAIPNLTILSRYISCPNKETYIF